ncbi:MAG TPA: molybdenum ABC transporter ATP-binding protein [Steroidobacteraceae bacterium]|nr:molybdenum ABC transporter ATP-binding protein [Steroidobacteraceae bacterium]
MIEVQLKKRRGEFALEVAFAASGSGLIALYGPSGCGKSTIVNLIAGLLRPDEGVVRLGGTTLFESARGVDVPAERRRIGYVFQDSRLFPHLDVRGNLVYGERRSPPGEPQIPFDEAVELLGLGPLLTRRPRQLSGGERQRVAVGRALLCRPRLLLLDEPLASLDLARREELLPYLERLRDRLSIPMIYVSHQFEEVLRLATHVVLLRAGAVVAQGDIVAVSRDPQLRAMIGTEALGAVVEGEIESVEAVTGLAHLKIGNGRLNVQGGGLTPGQRVRVQLLARDLILAVEPPRGLSVRNCLEGTLSSLEPDVGQTYLAEIDVGGPRLIAQVTSSASTELALSAGRRVWVLVKTVSLRGHVYSAAQSQHPSAGRSARSDATGMGARGL